MERLKDEFKIVDIVLLAIAILFVLAGYWIVSIVASYLIVRRICTAKLKVIAFVLLTLQLLSTIVVSTGIFLTSILRETLDINSSVWFGMTNIIHLSLQVITYAVIIIATITNPKVSKLIHRILVIISVPILMVVIVFLIKLVFPGWYGAITLQNSVLGLLQFDDYLIGIAIAILYKDLLLHPKDEEVFETYKETI